jgi:hypothetical protein
LAKTKKPTVREQKMQALRAEGSPSSIAAAYAMGNYQHDKMSAYFYLECPNCGDKLRATKPLFLAKAYASHEARHRSPGPLLPEDHDYSARLKPYSE